MKQELMQKQKLPKGWKWCTLGEVSKVFSGSPAPVKMVLPSSLYNPPNSVKYPFEDVASF